MAGYAAVSIQDKVNGCNAKVGYDGAVRQSPGIGDTANQGFVATTSWEPILPANPNRRQVQLQNQSADTPVLIRFDDESSPITGYRVDPGTTYSFPPGVTYTGVIQFKCNSGEAQVALLEFNGPAEDDEDNDG